MNLRDKFPITECFGIDISIQKDYPLIEKDKKTILQILPSSILSFLNPTKIKADPFLFVFKDRLFLFYENQTYFNKGGNINMVSTLDLKHWTKPIPILDDEGTHFSFPYVFEDNGSIYMIPETGWSGTIRLYKAVDDTLTKFILVKNLLTREKRPKDIIFDYADNVLFKKDGIYYLFTSLLDEKGYYLQLYTASFLEGPYKLHPSTPLQYNKKYGRNGGSLIVRDDKLFRVAQDCSDTYGGDIHLMEITELSPLTYDERPYAEHLIPKDLPFYKKGGHQLNFVKFRGNMVVATDAKKDRCFYLLKPWHKLLKILKIKK